jgi:hypothetical protein
VFRSWICRARAFAASFAVGTAEITTNAIDIGPSSVMLRSICAEVAFGRQRVETLSRAAVNAMVGRPDGMFTTPMSRHHTP